MGAYNFGLGTLGGKDMACNLKELYAKLDPDRREVVEARVQDALKAMPLDGLRDAREMPQTSSKT